MSQIGTVNRKTVQSYSELKRKVGDLSRENATLRNDALLLVQTEQESRTALQKTKLALERQCSENTDLKEAVTQLQIGIRDALVEQESSHSDEIQVLTEGHEKVLAAVTGERDFIEARMLECGFDPVSGKGIGLLSFEEQCEIEELKKMNSKFAVKASDAINSYKSKMKAMILRCQNARQMTSD
eukprot:m.47188 g.47188  ORF g.47188 m.47188 type:complete len:184 (+) comp33768_c0_seq1:59-610(+)